MAVEGNWGNNRYLAFALVPKLSARTPADKLFGNFGIEAPLPILEAELLNIRSEAPPKRWRAGELRNEG
jgi:hypothetical protein